MHPCYFHYLASSYFILYLKFTFEISFKLCNFYLYCNLLFDFAFLSYCLSAILFSLSLVVSTMDRKLDITEYLKA